jgi:uncharacterized phage protein (TIGR01671 family)
MREILFRGKIKGEETGVPEFDWAFGNLVVEQSTGKMFIADMARLTNGTKINEVVIEVMPQTVGQFTGLCDKNGAKIFEGDVVSVHDVLLRCDERYHEFIGFVSFDRASFTIDGNDGMTHYRWADYDVEVIGNIHDNPELLEG